VGLTQLIIYLLLAVVAVVQTEVQAVAVADMFLVPQLLIQVQDIQ
jgi:hypothetical protein